MPRGGRGECHVGSGESATWGQGRVPRGGRGECHVGSGEDDTRALSPRSRSGDEISWVPIPCKRKARVGDGAPAKDEHKDKPKDADSK